MANVNDSSIARARRKHRRHHRLPSSITVKFCPPRIHNSELLPPPKKKQTRPDVKWRLKHEARSRSAPIASGSSRWGRDGGVSTSTYQHVNDTSVKFSGRARLSHIRRTQRNPPTIASNGHRRQLGVGSLAKNSHYSAI